MTTKSIKQRLKSGEKLYGGWIEMFSPIGAEIMALSGYDLVMIDLEHGPGSFMDAIGMMQATGQHHCPALIRTSSNSPADLKRTLDIGPAGIMVPNIRNVQEAEALVDSCRYGPRGSRGAAPVLIRGSDYGQNIQGYGDLMNDDFLLIAQIESLEAVEQIDAIAAVDGIDMLFIGPCDLSGTVGELSQYDSPAFRDAFERTEKATLAGGKLLGSITFASWDAKRLYDNGHSLILSGADSLLLKNAALADVSELKKAAGR